MTRVLIKTPPMAAQLGNFHDIYELKSAESQFWPFQILFSDPTKVHRGRYREKVVFIPDFARIRFLSLHTQGTGPGFFCCFLGP